jgi:hypothetical protein
MGRTEAIRSVFWDDDFKVGEHEDFFSYDSVKLIEMYTRVDILTSIIVK